MVTEIPKGTADKKIKSILKKRSGKNLSDKSFAAFFGKLPKIEEGLTFQKRVRSE